jgi:hypothetical protein
MQAVAREGTTSALGGGGINVGL